MEGIRRGLRPNVRAPVSLQSMTSLVGLFPEDGLLKSLETFTKTSLGGVVEACNFPYPQAWRTKDGSLIVATATKIYAQTTTETLVLKLGGLTTGNPWDLVDFNGQLYMCNGQQLVKRHPESLVWSVTTIAYDVYNETYQTLTKAATACEVGGQLVFGNFSLT